METYRLRIFYEKTGASRFISGRNMLKIIQRTLRCADVPLKFTEGFSPHPKISFGHPLPLNICGTNEAFDVFLGKKIPISVIIEKTRAKLPEGTSFIRGEWIDKNAPSINSVETFAKYTILTENELHEEELKKFGKIIESEKTRTVIFIKINNFSHKSLMEILFNASLKSVGREITGNGKTQFTQKRKTHENAISHAYKQ